MVQAKNNNKSPSPNQKNNNAKSPKSGQNNDEDEYVRPSQRPELSDLKPIPQDDGPLKCVEIAYSPLFREIYDYFRAVYVNEEYSERGLEICDEAIQCNPANYTAWWFRRKCLIELGMDLREELGGFCSEWMEKSPKNYQVWYFVIFFCDIFENVLCCIIWVVLNSLLDCDIFHS